MRKKIVAGNWKMNKDLSEGIDLAKEVNDKLSASDVTVVLGTPFIHLAEVSKVVNKENLFVSAQNSAAEASGAYTGEVSAAMVKSTGAEYVILGHSERRSYYGDTDEILKQKVKLALENNLQVIFCCGEVLEERESNKQFEVVKDQLTNALFDLLDDEFKNIVIAYEPVWAIGTGKTATADQAQEMHKVIREHLATKFGQNGADETSILYGGSCKPSNAGELFANPDVDGGLIGGASLKAEDFMGIVNAF
jgi:triosephosphate isomerase